MSTSHEVVVQTGMGAITVGSLGGWLPEIAAVFSVVYYGIMVWESATGQRLRARFKAWRKS